MKKFLLQIKWLIYKSKPVRVNLIVNTCINVVLSGLSIYLALLSKALIDAATNADLILVFKWIKVLAIIFLIQLSLRALGKYLHTYTITKLLNTIQKQLFKHLIYSRWQSQSNYHSMHLLGYLNNDAIKITTLVCDTLPSLVTLTVTFLISFITLFQLDPKIAFLTLLVGPVFTILSLSIRKKMKQLYHQTQNHEIKYNTFLQENLQNIITLKSFCHETSSMSELKYLQERRLKLNLHTCRLTIEADSLLSIGSTLTYFLIFSLTTYKLSCHQITFGTLAALLQIYRNVQGPLSNLASSVATIIQGGVCVERFIEIEEIPEEMPRFLSEATSLAQTQLISELKTGTFEKIKLENISVAYNDQEPVLKNINLEINRGDMIGLIGPSGCGKTTLIRLLLSLITPLEGKVTCMISQKEVPLTPLCRHLMSYVPQGNTLFSGTIEENIIYGNSKAKTSQVEKAARLAAALPFIDTLSKGFETPIGEKNKGLSEGQAQRLAIARAFLYDRPILILDEATSALDRLTEKEILKQLKNLESHPTCIVITHRPSALSICNYVYEIKDGTLIKKDISEIL
ncbi:ABC transporter ATP-binding protein [Cellulosilyticum ruminicola]|uniref:ABC transporter ATP-binding protein n=1 Tax=Cellulosilyticum ruminicola TaxID=425254 RepID=UPI0006D1C998|nr:ABC transporter ATP-binding protein [Cellulosilyticum ruminicola]